MASTDKQAEFGKLRAFFWPIHNYELKKLLPMFFMFFFIAFVYTILRNAKDGLIIHAAPGVGAEILPVLKTAGVVPAAILFMFIYAKGANNLSKANLFYATVFSFIAFFALFGAYIYPNADVLHMTTEGAAQLRASLPGGLGKAVPAIQYWTFSLFYIFSELWGSMILSLLFWGFANDITRVSEAKRFYALFGIGANIALYFAGGASKWISQQGLSNADTWLVPCRYLTGTTVVSGIVIMVIYAWINKNVLTDARFYDPAELLPKKSKPKMTTSESLKFLLGNKHLVYIALLVLAYNISINLIEVTWKEQARLLYTDKNALQNFNGLYSQILGITTILMMLFVSGNVLRRFGWTFGALVTPVVLLLSGAGFFSFILFREELTPLVHTWNLTPLFVAVIFGTIQNVMSKASKYSLFDPTKEMAYIPLDSESKVKGKAAIDVVGARLGKASGSGIQLGLIAFYGSLAAVTPHIAACLLAIILVWIWAAKRLGDSLKTDFNVS